MALSRREFIGGLAVTFVSALARRLSAEAAAPEFPEGAKVEVSPRSKSFAVADLPAGKSVKFRVTPRNAAGKGGRSLVSEAFRVPTRENV